MHNATKRLRVGLAAGLSVLGLVALSSARAGEGDQAKEILAGAGVRGGLVVHLGCGDGSLTAALRANDGYLVHGLGRDAASVEKARAHIRSRGPYGPVGAEGATLWAASAADGAKKAELKLDGVPVFDGMAAAHGRLYIATTDGRVLCLAKPR
ncbi:MAG: hypothetical protein FJ290_10790 [Planctomycetes bacterium]|nr:hypothetical protein [Planctomycetota bacterium]